MANASVQRLEKICFLLIWVEVNWFRFSGTNQGASLALNWETSHCYPCWQGMKSLQSRVLCLPGWLSLSQRSHCPDKQNSMPCYDHHDSLHIIRCTNEVIIKIIHAIINKYFSTNMHQWRVQQIKMIYNCGKPSPLNAVWHCWSSMHCHFKGLVYFFSFLCCVLTITLYLPC